MKIIYIIGPMTPKGNRPDTDNAAIEYLLNVRDLVRTAIELAKKGWAPYCPGLDLQYFLCLYPGEMITESQVYGLSMAFLEISDAVFVLPRWKSSTGSQKEYSRAVELGMPIYMSMEDVPNER